MMLEEGKKLNTREDREGREQGWSSREPGRGVEKGKEEGGGGGRKWGEKQRRWRGRERKRKEKKGRRDKERKQKPQA